jgi:hypothetical protein
MSRQLPTGARINGMRTEVPSTVVRRSHTGVATAQRGRNLTVSNAWQFARDVASTCAAGLRCSKRAVAVLID